MKRESFIRRCAAALARLAVAVFPPTRCEWRNAMLAELDHIDGDFRALRWAFGCATAGFKLRMTAMNLGTFRVSRWVLVLEMALCFVPMTLGWLDVVFGPSGVAWLDPASVERYYLGTTEGVAALTKMVAGAVIGVLGPLGLLVAARHIVLGRVLRRGWLSSVLIGGPIVLGVVYVAMNFATDTEWSVEWGGFYVLFVAVPIAGAAHLLYDGYSSPDARAPRASTA